MNAPNEDNILKGNDNPTNNKSSFPQSRDPAVQAAILAQLNAKYGSGVLPDAPKDMTKASPPSIHYILSCSFKEIILIL